jgi:hypothetical protein
MLDRHPRAPAPPGRLFFGVITGIPELFERARERIEARIGELEPGDESPVFPFPPTKSYGKSMGGSLARKFFFLRAPWPQDGLARAKIAAIEIEEEIQAAGNFEVPRAVNIDPGLLNDCRIILASTKDHGHRIYRGDGIWEELELVFEGGAYRPLPWTYADFRNPDYAAYFTPIRTRHLRTLGGR